MRAFENLLKDPALLWYLNRATGFVLLITLTVTTALGVASVGSPGDPRAGRLRLGTQLLHRRLAALSLAVLVGHLVPAIADSYVDLGWIDALVPFVAAYKPLWLGLGTLAFDVLLLVAVTAWLRHRVSWWRGAHLLTYAVWPMAVAHSIGIGTDARDGWGLGIVLGCSAVVAWAVVYRLRSPETRSTDAVPVVRSSV